MKDETGKDPHTSDLEWRSIDSWDIEPGEAAGKADVFMAGAGGAFRFQARIGDTVLEDADLGALYRRVALRSGSAGDSLAEDIEAVQAFQGFGADSRGRELQATNAAAVMGLAYSTTGFRGPIEAIEQSLEKQTDGKARRGWIQARVEDTSVAFLVFRDATAVAVMDEGNGIGQILPLVVDMRKPFRAHLEKGYQATIGTNKEPKAGETDATILYGPRASATVITLPRSVEDLPGPLARDITGIARQMVLARQAFDALPPVRKPEAEEVDAGRVARIDRCGMWEDAAQSRFYWPAFLPHRSVRLDAFDEHREIVEAYVKMALWADPDIVSPVKVDVRTLTGSGSLDNAVEIEFDLSSRPGFGYSAFVRKVESAIEAAVPGLGDAVGFKAMPGNQSASVSGYHLMEIEVARPSARSEHALEARFGAVFSDQPGYRAPGQAGGTDKPAPGAASVFDLMTGSVLGHPGVPVETDHDVLAPMVDEGDPIYGTPMWGTLAGDVQAVRFEQEVARWAGPAMGSYFPRPQQVGRKWGFSLLVSEIDDPRCEVPLGFISAEVELAPPPTPLKYDDPPEEEIYRLDISVIGWAASDHPAAGQGRAFLGLVSGLLEALKLEVLELNDAGAEGETKAGLEVLVRCDAGLDREHEIRDLMTRSLSVLGDELRYDAGISLTASDAGDGPSELLRADLAGLPGKTDTAEPKTDLARAAPSPFLDGICGTIVDLPRGEISSDHAEFSEIFLNGLLGQLQDMGVVLEDLQPRVIDIWDPSGELDGLVHWMPRADLSRESLVDLQADIVSGRMTPRTYTWHHHSGSSRSARLVMSATTQIEVLGAWLKGALNILRARRNPGVIVEQDILPPYGGPQHQEDWRMQGRAFEIPAGERRRRGFDAREVMTLVDEYAPAGIDHRFLQTREIWDRRTDSGDLPSPRMISLETWDDDLIHAGSRHPERIPLLKYLAGTLALNARTHAVVEFRAHEDPPSGAVEDAVRARIAEREETSRRDHEAWKKEQARVAALPTLERRHHKLAPKWQGVFKPGEMQINELEDEQLLALAARVAKEPLSVFLGVQQKVLADRVMDARRRHFGAREGDWRPRQASLKAMAPEDVSAAAAHVSPEAMARRCGVSRKAATEAVRDADQEVFGAGLVPAACRKLLRAAEAA